MLALYLVLVSGNMAAFKLTTSNCAGSPQSEGLAFWEPCLITMTKESKVTDDRYFKVQRPVLRMEKETGSDSDSWEMHVKA